MNGFEKCWKYAINNGVHNGPATKQAFRSLYDDFKGSQYRTIVALFLAIGRINFLKEYYED